MHSSYKGNLLNIRDGIKETRPAPHDYGLPNIDLTRPKTPLTVIIGERLSDTGDFHMFCNGAL